MSLQKPKSYRSYLIRCWVSPPTASGNSIRARFVVEAIAEEPQRWGFDTFDDLVAFLRSTLSQDEAAQPDEPQRSDT